MKPDVSIILPTNRLNDKVFGRIKSIQDGLKKYNYDDIDIFNDEFIPLLHDRLNGIKHYLELTLKSLESQSISNYELIISHRYPEDAIDIVKQYDIPVKLVREKPSIWHDIGPQYGTLCNNINTGVIHSKGELLWRIDDMEFFNNDALKEMWDLYKRGFYCTSRAIRSISFDERLTNMESKITTGGRNKFRYEKYNFRGIVKPLTDIAIGHELIPSFACWGYSSTLSIKDFLDVNGHDEIYDGAVCGTDMELGQRLLMKSRRRRLSSKNWMYELDETWKGIKSSIKDVRDDVMLRQLWDVRNIQANSWKPTQKQLDTYQSWHKENMGDLDPNWWRLMDVPFVNIKEEYKLKRLGEIVYDNTNN